MPFPGLTRVSAGRQATVDLFFNAVSACKHSPWCCQFNMRWLARSDGARRSPLFRRKSPFANSRKPFLEKAGDSPLSPKVVSLPSDGDEDLINMPGVAELALSALELSAEFRSKR